MTDFERFFDNEFKERLDGVGDEPGALSSGMSMTQASWDRKAALLLWDALGRPVTVQPAPATVGLNVLADQIFKDLLG